MSKARQLAKKYKKQISENESDDSDQENLEFEVEEILDRKLNPKTKTISYQVKWKGWDIKDSTWEPISNLQNVKDMVKEFDENFQEKDANSTKTGQQNSQKAAKEQPSSSKTFSHSSKSQTVQNSSNTKEDSKKKQTRSYGPLSQRKNSLSESSQSELIAEEHQEAQKNDGKCQEFQQLEEGDFVFEEILAKKFQDGENHYLIKFSNCGEAQWLEESQLDAIKDEIQLYENKLKEVTEEGDGKSKTAKVNPKQDQIDTNENFEEEGEEVKELKQKIPPSQRLAARRSQSKGSLEEEKTQRVTRTSVAKVAQKPQTMPKQSNTLRKINPVSSNFSQSLENSPKKVNQLLKRQPIDLNSVPSGDFKTDNIDKVEFYGQMNDLLSSKFEVFWKTRLEGVTPSSQIYSFQYLRRNEPRILIDLLFSTGVYNLGPAINDLNIQQTN